MLLEGRPVPEPFLAMPEILPQAAYYWSVYCDLQSERSYGMSIGPIPVSAVKSYIESEGLSEEEGDFLWHVIREVDNEHLKLMNKRSDTSKATPISDAKGMKRLLDNRTKK